MKTNYKDYSIVFSVVLMLFLVTGADAQILKKLGKTAERAAERTVQRRVDQETSKKTDQVLDSILEPGSGGTQNDPGAGTPPSEGGKPGVSGSGNSNTPAGEAPSMEVYSKFDFVPGDKQLFFDDFGNDFIGDFPAKWNTNGSGEVVTIGDSPQKWLELTPGINIFYIPDVPDLPEEYTIEFDVRALGIDQKTSSTTLLKVGVSDNTTFNWGKYAFVNIPFCQYHPVGFHIRNGAEINSNIQGDIRQKVLGQPHISIAVNQQRFRLWVDESKYVDVPRMIQAGTKPIAVKFEARNFKDGKERIFISNIKVAEGGVDLRRKLISDGKISTNGILFDTGSANIQPRSMGIIRQISQVLLQERDMRLRIVGHTDSDGEDTSNMALSEQRAAAVKNALINIYNIDQGRLETEGKGESEPVGDNNTVDGRSQNRRVEFIKIQ